MKKNKNVLVTGGAGFIGSNLVDELVKRKYKVVIIDNLSTGLKKNINPKVKFYKLDIIDKKIENVFKKEKIDIVFHLAAQINVRESVNNPILDAKINIIGGLNVLENCKKYKVNKIIFSSSGGTIYGESKIIPTRETCIENPQSPYGIAKLTLEKYLNYYKNSFGIDFVSLRLANVYGPRQNPKGEAGVVAIFFDKMLSKKQVKINGSGKQTRDYVFVKDVVNALLLASEKNITGIFNVGTGIQTDVNFIFNEIKKITNSNCIKINAPENKGELQKSCLDYSKIKKYAKWQAKYKFKDGLKETLNYIRENE